jgi:hypothetical protein
MAEPQDIFTVRGRNNALQDTPFPAEHIARKILTKTIISLSFL